ncbi:MAG: hypothetical protein AVO33_01155 [delta proteobacterium ML8_F1]|nr:MAG: hypothetical protein AVO33_01155 [delta proteobacterium ML8_F1]
MTHEANNLWLWGLTDIILRDASFNGEGRLGRVIEEQRGEYKVVTGEGFTRAVITGKNRYQIQRKSDFPAVGDWVMVSEHMETALIRHRLDRWSSFERKSAGRRHEAQVVAANIDEVYICMALDKDFNLRRLERYLTVSWESGAVPVVLLTKLDLCDNPQAAFREAEAVAPGVRIMGVSLKTMTGLQELKDALTPGRTLAFIGSSGVGKSSLINYLRGFEALRTQEVRGDGKGRHTTTHRQLFRLTGGALVIDTPGMRELGLDGAEFHQTFGDIEALVRECRFSDCTHTNEPGCAVRAAIEAQELDEKRLRSYLKLQAESTYALMNSRQIEDEKIKKMFTSKAAMKQKIKAAKEKNRR